MIFSMTWDTLEELYAASLESGYSQAQFAEAVHAVGYDPHRVATYLQHLPILKSSGSVIGEPIEDLSNKQTSVASDSRSVSSSLKAHRAFDRRDVAFSRAKSLKGDELAAALREMVAAHEEGKASQAESRAQTLRRNESS